MIENTISEVEVAIDKEIKTCKMHPNFPWQYKKQQIATTHSVMSENTTQK